MKKLLMTALLGMATIAYAQCTVQGNESLQIGEQGVYTISTEDAQCKDCHQWKIFGESASLVGDDRKNRVGIFANKSGSITVNVTVLTPRGIEECSKKIDIQGDDSVHMVTPPKNCDIVIDDFKEVKYDEKTAAFFPIHRKNDYKYDWEVYYANGTKQKSEERIPTFEYTPENYIQKIEANITSNKCMKKLTKKYDQMYWKVFNQNK